MANKIEPGFYWLYYKALKEWTIAEFDGDTWEFIGNDGLFKELSDVYEIGSKITNPNNK